MDLGPTGEPQSFHQLALTLALVDQAIPVGLDLEFYNEIFIGGIRHQLGGATV
jgi:hypothetical protein